MFVPQIYLALRRVHPEDELIGHNLFWMFKLPELRVVYTLIQQQVPGLNLLFPVLFTGKEDDYQVVWVGDHDPYSLYDSILVHATTKFGQTGKMGARLEVNWESPAFVRCCCGYSQAHIRAIMAVTPPTIFDEVFKSFIRLLGVLVPCPAYVEEDHHKHPSPCSLCKDEGRLLLHQILKNELRPSGWLERVTGMDWPQQHPPV